MSVSLSLCEISSMVWFKLKSNIVNCYRFRFNETLVVSTKSGPVKGYEMGSNFGYQYFNFFGIPYAKPPIGDLRFKVFFYYFTLRINILRKKNILRLNQNLQSNEKKKQIIHIKNS